MKRTERIAYYEGRLDKVNHANQTLAAALEEFREAKSMSDELASYLSSSEWKRDYAADEKGRLPNGLKRGVLSEDGIFNALEDYRSMLVRLLETAAQLI